MNIIIISYGYSYEDMSTSHNVTSESRSAYGLVRCINRKHNVNVITKDRTTEEGVISVGSNRFLTRAEKVITRDAVGQLKLDYPCFARRAAQTLRNLNNDFDMVQQISPISFRYPGVLPGTGVPFIWGPIGGSIPYPKGFEQVRKREPHLRQLRSVERMRLTMDPWLRRTLSRASKILVTSELAKLNIPRQYRYKSEVFPEGIDVAEVQRESLHGEKEIKSGIQKNYIFTSGKLIPYKAIDLAIKAFARINAGDTDLVITGDGPEMTGLRRIASDLGVSHRVHFLGKVSSKVNLALMKRSLFCVYPALKEAFGRVNLEAMCLGKAIIVTDWGGSRDIVVDGVTGFKVLGADVEEQVGGMSKYMALLLEEKGRRENLGINALDRVTNYYSWDVLCGRLERIYNDVCSNRD